MDTIGASCLRVSSSDSNQPWPRLDVTEPKTPRPSSTPKALAVLNSTMRLLQTAGALLTLGCQDPVRELVSQDPASCKASMPDPVDEPFNKLLYERALLPDASMLAITDLDTGAEKPWAVFSSILASRPICDAGLCEAKIFRLDVCVSPNDCTFANGGPSLAIANCFPILFKGFEGQPLTAALDSRRFVYRYLPPDGGFVDGVIDAPGTLIMNFSRVVELMGSVELRAVATRVSGKLQWELNP